MIGKYQLLESIKNGNMFVGIDKETEKKVAIKYNSCENGYRILKKRLKLLKDIKHNNMLTPFETIELENAIYAVYEYYPVITLADYVEIKGNCTELEVRDIARQLLSAYKELIKNKMPHGNIKPQNILLVERAPIEIKLCDFGIGIRRHNADNPYISRELSGTLFKYSAEIWSIGAVLYFTINGVAPIWNSCNIYPMQREWQVSRTFSPHCIDFILRCLRYKKSKPWKIEKIERHMFLSEKVLKVIDCYPLEELKKEDMNAKYMELSKIAFGNYKCEYRYRIYLLLWEKRGCSS